MVRFALVLAFLYMSEFAPAESLPDFGFLESARVASALEGAIWHNGQTNVHFLYLLQEGKAALPWNDETGRHVMAKMAASPEEIDRQFSSSWGFVRRKLSLIAHNSAHGNPGIANQLLILWAKGFLDGDNVRSMYDLAFSSAKTGGDYGLTELRPLVDFYEGRTCFLVEGKPRTVEAYTAEELSIVIQACRQDFLNWLRALPSQGSMTESDRSFLDQLISFCETMDWNDPDAVKGLREGFMKLKTF